jgi:hypothetical protein
MFQRHTLDGDIYFHVFQELSLVLFTLMKSTEPFPGQFLEFNMLQFNMYCELVLFFVLYLMGSNFIDAICLVSYLYCLSFE